METNPTTVGFFFGADGLIPIHVNHEPVTAKVREPRPILLLPSRELVFA